MPIRFVITGLVLIAALGALVVAAVVPNLRGEPETKTDAPAAAPPGMVWIPGGTFTMGDRRGAPDKHPEHLDEIPEHKDSLIEHEVSLDGFW
ncbi:MAG: hypothetical protein ACREIV_11065, partial [Planctomycetaceae bacterium]